MLTPLACRRPLVAAALLATGLAAHELAAQTPLSRGIAVSGTVGARDTLRYTLRADSAFVVRIKAEQQPGNVALRLLGPTNAVLGTVNATTAGFEELHLVTRESGTHQLQITAGDSVGGTFRVSLLMNEKLSKDPKRLMDQLLAPWDRPDGPGVAVAVWRGDRTVFTKAYGMANLAYDIPFTVATPTNIDSTSKQFTAFAVMLLVEEGKLSLDDDVRQYIPHAQRQPALQNAPGAG